MADDPFARFERSRRGLLIPVAIFAAGAIATVAAMNLVVRIDRLEQRAAAAEAEAAAAEQSADKVAPKSEVQQESEVQRESEVQQESDLQPADPLEPTRES